MVLVGFGVIFTGILGMAATLWLEFREIDRRNRLVKNVESVLKSQDLSRAEEVQFKRAA